MKTCVLIILASLALVGCDRDRKPIGIGPCANRPVEKVPDVCSTIVLAGLAAGAIAVVRRVVK
jgi:hypothetical protein